MPDETECGCRAERCMKRLLERLTFTATYGNTEWATSVLQYIAECCEDVEGDNAVL